MRCSSILIPTATFTLAATLWCTAPAHAAAPFLEKVQLYEEKTGGFVSYRIPCLIVTAKGTVLTFCEARKYSGLDWGEIEIHQRRSTDGGRTFSPSRQVAHLGPRLPRNPANADQPPGKAIGEPGQQTVNNPASTRREKMTVYTSADEGQTWQELLVLHSGPAANSCLIALSPSAAACLYERGEKNRYEKITLARFGVP